MPETEKIKISLNTGFTKTQIHKFETQNEFR